MTKRRTLTQRISYVAGIVVGATALLLLAALLIGLLAWGVSAVWGRAI